MTFTDSIKFRKQIQEQAHRDNFIVSQEKRNEMLLILNAWEEVTNGSVTVIHNPWGADIRLDFYVMCEDGVVPVTRITNVIPGQTGTIKEFKEVLQDEVHYAKSRGTRIRPDRRFDEVNSYPMEHMKVDRTFLM